MDDKNRARRSAAGRVGLGLRLRQLRKVAGLTLAELSAEAGGSRSNLSDIEGGKRLPALDVLDAVCWATGTTVADALVGVSPFGAAHEPRLRTSHRRWSSARLSINR